MEGWGQGMSSLPGTPLPPALLCLRGTVGVLLPQCPHASTKPCRGIPVPQHDRDCYCCAQGTASLWQFCMSPPDTTIPLFPVPGKAWEALLHPAVLPFPEKTVTGSFSTSATLPAKSVPLFLPSLAKSLVLGFPLHGALAVAGSAAHHDAPREQSLPASSSKGLQGVQGGHAPAGC